MHRYDLAQHSNSSSTTVFPHSEKFKMAEPAQPTGKLALDAVLCGDRKMA